MQWGRDRQPATEHPATLVDVEELTRKSAFLAHSDYTVPEAMHEVVRQIPDVVAVDSGTDRITFAELETRANRVANALLDRGLEQSVPVFVLCDHGTAPPVAICGVLHAGLIGVPVDVLEPEARLRRLLDASGAQWVVTDRAHLDVAHALSDKVVVLDETESFGTSAPAITVDREHPGLVLFTSGSTGVPKGVVGRHRAIVPKSMRHGVRQIVGDERYALTASWGFTAAEGVLFNGLMNGLTTCTYDLRTRGLRDLPDWVRSMEITHISFMPSVLRALADMTEPRTMESLREVSFGGEPLYWSDVRLARRLFGPDTRLTNGLGSTEAGGICWYGIPPGAEQQDGPVPVGMTTTNVEVRIVDEDDRVVPEGEPGRILVVRRGHLALGYWRDPELTAAHFYREPDGRQAFRSSDRGRRRPDGLLEHLGRLDTRVKVRGAMVATSEVEIALMSLPGVVDAAVIAVPLDDGGTRLVAYVVGDGRAPLSAWRLRRDIATRVPTTMVPSAFVAVEQLPRTIRDKIDRAALPPPPPPVRPRPYREPHGNDRDLADIFATVLGIDRVGLDDDFFELGGDSLAVMELLAAIAERFSVDVPTSTVLDAPTVAELGLRLSHRRPRDASIVVPLRTGVSSAPFFCMTGGGAPAISLRALSDVMKHDFYAVQPRGLEECARPDHTVAAAARRNLVALRAVQPRGPYALGGYSFGGFVAFEMACRLRELGEDVVVLVILDTVAPLAAPSVTNRLRARANALRAGAPASRARRTAAITARAAKFAVASAYDHAERRVTLTTAGLVPRRGYHQYDVFLRLHTRMAIEYQPTSTFDGPVLVVRGATSDGRPPGVVLDPGVEAVALERRRLHDLGWSKLVSGPVTVAEVPGDHFDILRQPAVAHVGARVGEALAAAWSSTTATR